MTTQAASAEAFTGPTTELLQSLIRNACVNDGTPDSGGEIRNADLLTTYLEGAGLAVHVDVHRRPRVERGGGASADSAPRRR